MVDVNFIRKVLDGRSMVRNNLKYIFIKLIFKVIIYYFNKIFIFLYMILWFIFLRLMKNIGLRLCLELYVLCIVLYWLFMINVSFLMKSVFKNNLFKGKGVRFFYVIICD